MLETQFYGKILPSHPSIKPILLDVRQKYKVPEIEPGDNGFRVLLEYELEIDWKAVHAEIMQRLKDIPDLIPEKARDGYLKFKKFIGKPFDDPELKKVSKSFRDGVLMIVDYFIKMYQPQAEKIDGFYQTLTDHCVEFLLTGEARPIPEDWIFYVKTLTDSNGEKTVIAIAGALANPDVIADEFRAEYRKAFGADHPVITEKAVTAADYLRDRWFDKSINYVLEEDEIRNPKGYAGRKSRRYPTAARRHHSRMRQKLSRLEKELFEILK